jgi:hypothetical protein
MSIFYNLTIESTAEKNHFQIAWKKPGKNSTDSFIQSTDIVITTINCSEKRQKFKN